MRHQQPSLPAAGVTSETTLKGDLSSTPYHLPSPALYASDLLSYSTVLHLETNLPGLFS